MRQDDLELTLMPVGFGIADQPCWIWKIPSIIRKPFREARLRIDGKELDCNYDQQLVRLFVDTPEIQKLVLELPQFSINQPAGQVGRCRKQMAKLLRVSWLSPRIVEAIASGSQPKTLHRNRLLEADLPADWAEQEMLLGFSA